MFKTKCWRYKNYLNRNVGDRDLTAIAGRFKILLPFATLICGFMKYRQYQLDEEERKKKPKNISVLLQKEGEKEAKLTENAA